MRPTILRALVRVSLLMAFVIGTQAEGSKGKAPAPVEKTEWRLVWLAGTRIEVAAPRQLPYIQLDPESHRVSGSGGCNRLMGAYELSGDHLKFTQMAVTRMACMHGGDTESSFVDALNRANSWKMAKGKLLLLDSDGHVMAKFSAYTPEDAQHPAPSSSH